MTATAAATTTTRKPSSLLRNRPLPRSLILLTTIVLALVRPCEVAALSDDGPPPQSSAEAGTATGTTTKSASTPTKSEQLRFGTIEMQMRSRSSSSRNDFLFQVLSQTGHFLDEVLSEEYAGTAYEFSHVTLSVDGIGIEAPEDGGKEGPTDAYVFLEGTAVFAGGGAPTSDTVVHEVVDLAFQERNTFFLELLTGSKNPLLRDITFAIVTVNEYTEVVDDEEGAEGQEPSPGGIVASTGQTGQPNNTSGGRKLEVWMIAVIAIAGFCLLIMVAFIVWACRLCSKDNVEAASAGQPEIPSRKPSSQTSRSDGESGSHPSDIENVLVAITSTDGENESSKSPQSPSPLHSITSQDSSAFTYNPTSRGSNGNGSTRSFFTNNSKVELDVEAWQRGSTVNTSGVFGAQDISAIDPKKDLSLIEEGDEASAATPQPSLVDASLTDDSKSNNTNSTSLGSGIQPRRLTRTSLLEIDRQDRSAASSAGGRNRNHRHSMVNLDGPSAQVIDDLNDLSAQIDGYRRRVSK